MSNSIKNYLEDSRSKSVTEETETLLSSLREEGFKVEFGKIGIRTTYALIHSEDDSIEIVGYTFIQDIKYYKEEKGRLKALQQAIARKRLSESRQQDSGSQLY